MPRRWIQSALSKHTRGALHRQLSLPVGEKIPMNVLREAAEHPENFRTSKPAQRLLQRRARLALTLRILPYKKAFKAASRGVKRRELRRSDPAADEMY